MYRAKGGWLVAVAVLAFGAAFGGPAFAQACAEIVSVQGTIEVLRAGQTSWTPARANTRVCEGDQLRTGLLSRAALSVGPSALIRVEQNTVMGLRISAEATEIEFQSGVVYSITRFPRRYRIRTPFVNAGVEGTEFLVALERDAAEVAVFEGRVSADNFGITLASGQVGRFPKGAMPVLGVLVNPADAVQWALYYPPLEAESPGESIAQLSPARRAGRLLRLGRVERAEQELRQVPSGDAHALAIAALIRVVKNDKTGALELANRAVARDPRSVPALIALSYAEQAHFRLDQALAAASRAAELEPANAVAQARRAELLLSVGRIREAEAAASAAVQASPAESRARTVLGFAQLARLDTRRAREQLAQAAALDPSDPLPRLGLGLATIKDGRLAEGRSELEVAVALDPQNGLLRSYLGKAYSDEHRNAHAEGQLGRAKDLDPRDPTPWYYNAIRLQAINRPGEALEELQESIARNDNRAVYRSRLLLDQDQAARSASLAHIYSDLGFDELAVTEARYALIADPGAYAAHRFLADAYLRRPNFEIARIREVLQSQLLQPVHAAALPPQLQQIRNPVLTGSGPVTPSFQEFNPLFGRDRHSLSLGGVAGTRDTLSDEIVYGYYGGKRSFQLGQFYYRTDGFRINADLQQEAYRAFYQEDVSAQTSFQAELSRSEVKGGDSRFQFEPDSFSPVQRGGLEVNAFRLGGRYSWDPRSTLLASFITDRRKTRFFDSLVDPFSQLDFDSRSESKSYTGEIQYQGRMHFGELIAGAGVFERDEASTLTTTVLIPGFPPDVATAPSDVKLRSANGYLYGYLGRAWRARLVLGASIDSVANPDPFGPGGDTRVSPKLGAILPFATGMTVRLAAFRGFKRLPSDNPSIEPTQVAGFNQVFDDVNQTRFWRYGAALDQNWRDRFFAGLELSRRELDAPLFADVVEDRTEGLHRAYVSWLVSRRLAFGTELLMERIKRLPALFPGPIFIADEIDTRSLPITLSYHTPSGLFARGRVSVVRQQIHALNDFGEEQTLNEDFTVFDLSLGTRLPRRRGIVSLDISNVLDEKFSFRDTTFEGSPRVPQYAPERAMFIRLQLNL